MAVTYKIGTQKGADALAKLQNGSANTVVLSDGTQLYRTTNGGIVAEQNGVQMQVQNNYTPTTQVPQMQIPQMPAAVPPVASATTASTVNKSAQPYAIDSLLGSDIYNAILSGKMNNYSSSDGRTWFLGDDNKVYVKGDKYGVQNVVNNYTGSKTADYDVTSELGSDIYNDIQSGKRNSYNSTDGRNWIRGDDGNVYVMSDQYGLQRVNNNYAAPETQDTKQDEENTYLDRVRELEELLNKAKTDLAEQTKRSEAEKLDAERVLREAIDKIETEYQSKREAEIAKNKSNLENYTYDKFKNSSEYADLLSAYEQNGSRAMQDTLAEISARTGGLPSSYATSAAQQAYNNYLTNAEREAQQRYDTEYAKLMQLYQNEIGLDEQDYNRWQQGVANRLNAAAQLSDMDSNALNWYNALNNAQLGWYNALNNSAANEQNAELARRKQELAELQYQNTYGTASEATAREKAYETAITNAYGGDYSALASYWGTTPDAARARFTAMTTTKSSSGGSSSKSNKPALSASEARKAVIEDGIINDTTKAAYEYYFGEIPEDILSGGDSSNRVSKGNGLNAKEIAEIASQSDGRKTVEQKIINGIKAGATKTQVKNWITDAYEIDRLITRQDYQYFMDKYAS